MFSAACGQAQTPVVAGPSGSPSPAVEHDVVQDCRELDVAVPVDGPVSSDPEIAEAQRARARFALPSDERSVRTIIEQTGDGPYSLGFPHTQEEFNTILARNDVGGDRAALRRWAEQDASDAFGGMWLDHEAGGLFTISFTHDLEEYRRTVHERFDPAIRIVEAEHTFAELAALQEDIGQVMRSQDHTGGASNVEPGVINSTSLDELRNRVEIGIFEPDERVRRWIAERWDADAVCIDPIDIPEADDAQPALWEPAPDADLSASSTAFDVLVNERACASGQDAHGRIAPPVVTYREDAIIVTIGVIPKAGDADCQGNPNTPYTLHLDEPLNGRQLLDGRTDPPSPPSLEPS